MGQLTLRPLAEDQALYQFYQRSDKHPELIAGGLYFSCPEDGSVVVAIPVGHGRSIGTLDSGTYRSRVHTDRIAAELAKHPGFENAQTISLHGGWMVGWGEQAMLDQLDKRFRQQDHVWLGRAFGIPDELIEQHVRSLATHTNS